MKPYYDAGDVTIINADSRTAWQDIPEHCADALVTSPPYWGLRDYGVDGQIGLEDRPDEYVAELADLLTGYGERVMKPQGSLWLNLGDTYNSSPPGNKPGQAFNKSGLNNVATHNKIDASRDKKLSSAVPPKCLLMIPERVALALIDRGWILRNKVVWAKPNGMPSSVQDRLATKWEYVFHFVRAQRYHYDLDAIRRPHETAPIRHTAPTNEHSAGVTPQQIRGRESNRSGRSLAYAYADGVPGNPNGANPGDVWTIPTQPYPEAHFAVYPPELIRRPILATVPEGGTVCDPFFGSGTTGVMARRLGRKAIGVELNADYCALAADRFRQGVLLDGAA